MNLSRLEQETIITWSEAESAAEIFTFNGRMKRSLAKLAGDRPAEVRHVKSTPEGGETYTLPKGWLKIRAPRILDDEQRRELGERLRKSNLSAKTP